MLKKWENNYKSSYSLLCIYYSRSVWLPVCVVPLFWLPAQITWLYDCEECVTVVLFQMRDTAPSGWATSLKACRGSTSAEPATPPAPTAALLTWRFSPVCTRQKLCFYAASLQSFQHFVWKITTVSPFPASNAGVIAAATLGSVVGLVAMVLVLIFILRRRGDTEEEMANEIKWVSLPAKWAHLLNLWVHRVQLWTTLNNKMLLCEMTL